MPDLAYMMFGRPKNCRYCGHGYYGLQHVVNYANALGKWTILDLQKEQANKDPMYDALNQYDPLGLYHFGHGSNNVTTGDMEQPIFTSSECSILAGRIVYLLSCLTANGLGPAIIQNGGKAYAGFNISWTWMSSSGTAGDPYDDWYAKGFYESANELWVALLDGVTFEDALQQSRDKYTEWIDFWYNTPDPAASSTIKWLLYDRDGLVGLGDMGARLLPCSDMETQADCHALGCFWYNGSCHGELPENIADIHSLHISTVPSSASPRNLKYPPEVYEHFNYEISYDITNAGQDGTLFGQIRDNDTGDIIQGTYWEQPLLHNQSRHIVNIVYDMTKDMHLQLEVGHL